MSDKQFLIDLYNGVAKLLTSFGWETNPASMCFSCNAHLATVYIPIAKEMRFVGLLGNDDDGSNDDKMCPLCTKCHVKYSTAYTAAQNIMFCGNGDVASVDVDGITDDTHVVGTTDVHIAVGGKRKFSCDDENNNDSGSKRCKTTEILSKEKQSEQIIPIDPINVAAAAPAAAAASNDDAPAVVANNNKLKSFRDLDKRSLGSILNSAMDKELLSAQQAFWLAAYQTDLMTTLDEAVAAAKIEAKKKIKTRTKASSVVHRLLAFGDMLQKYQLWSEDEHAKLAAAEAAEAADAASASAVVDSDDE
jgi:hypothetical protein